jgi:hypothetical protein
MSMTKYRLLNSEELKNFEDEFVKYLVVNGIAAEDWRQILAERPEAAQKIIDLFSDVIFEKVLRQIEFLEFRSSKYIQSIHCQDNKMITVALSVTNDGVDLTETDWQTAQVEDFVIHKAEKVYDSSREQELFELTEKGFTISDGKLYKALMLASV